MSVVEYAVIIERASTRNYSAYAPDLPGCVATGRTVDETREKMRQAIRMHLESLREHGEATPRPTAIAEQVAV